MPSRPLRRAGRADLDRVIQSLFLYPRKNQSLIKTLTQMNNLNKVAAFHGDSAIKADVLLEATRVVRDGEIVRVEDVEDPDTDWDQPLRQYYPAMSEQFGMPVWLLMVSEHLVARMPVSAAEHWALDLVRAMPVGASMDEAWSAFVRQLLRSDNGGLGAYVRGAEESAVLIHLKTLHQFASPGLESFARKARLAEELALAGSNDAQTFALEAAAALGFASYYGGHGGTVALTRSARLAVRACHLAVQAILAGSDLTEADACVFVARLLLEIFQSLPRVEALEAEVFDIAETKESARFRVANRQAFIKWQKQFA
ncbi:MAG: hypothetical protein JSS86_04905, partial [Cyanobacteria bacterium SZAS LIN-2]|nr:hypothetical protein [Cyanobacteria bacterium SZAS LIN-2]